MLCILFEHTDDDKIYLDLGYDSPATNFCAPLGEQNNVFNHLLTDTTTSLVKELPGASSTYVRTLRI